MADKLKIIPGTLQGSSFSYSGSGIEVPFNPTEYSIEKGNSYNESKNPGLESPIIQFNQGNARKLTIELLLDTYTTDQAEKDDIRSKYIEKLAKLVNLDSEIHGPPPCKVVWGTLTFEGFLESMTKKYTMFSSDGTPVRARVTLSFKEYIPLDKQTKGAALASPDRRKLFKMQEGDSLWQMANRAYGDPGKWRIIAIANDIPDPRTIEVGRDLVIPVLEE